MESMQGGLGAGDGQPLPHHLLSRLPQPTLGSTPGRGGPAQHPGGSDGGQAESHQQREGVKDSHLHRGTHWAWSQAHMKSRFCCVALAEEPTHLSLSFLSNAVMPALLRLVVRSGGEGGPRRAWHIMGQSSTHYSVLLSLMCHVASAIFPNFSAFF